MISDEELKSHELELDVEECLEAIAAAITTLTTLGLRLKVRYKSKDHGKAYAATILAAPFSKKIKTIAQQRLVPPSEVYPNSAYIEVIYTCRIPTTLEADNREMRQYVEATPKKWVSYLEKAESKFVGQNKPKSSESKSKPSDSEEPVDDGLSVQRLVRCPVCGGNGNYEYPIPSQCPNTGLMTTGQGMSTCFLCMGSGSVHPLKKQMLDRGEIKIPTNGYYLPKSSASNIPLPAAGDGW